MIILVTILSEATISVTILPEAMIIIVTLLPEDMIILVTILFEAMKFYPGLS